MTRRFSSLIAPLSAATFLLAMAACSSGPPSSAAEEFLRAKIEKESQGRIKLVSFSKTNGQEATPMGIPSYKLDYEAEIEFLDDCRWGTKNDLNGGWRGDFSVFPAEEGPGYFGGLHPPFRKAAKGSQTKVMGAVMFQKTEAGWRPVEPPRY
jgi:hypothetical protein